MVTIVIAWAEKTAVLVRLRRAELSERPEMREEMVGKAAVWLNRGTPADVQRARAFAATEGYSVFCYATTEKEPLARARRDVLRAAKAA